MQKKTDSKFNRLLSVFLFSTISLTSFQGYSQARFVENKGQWPDQVEYKLRVANADLYFEEDRLTFNFHNPELLGTHDHGELKEEAHSHDAGHMYHVNFLNADPGLKVEAEEPFNDHINYLLGNDPAKWASGVKPYARTNYVGLYPGIDLKYFEKNGHLKYDVIIAPGSDPSQLRMEYSGVDRIELKSGNLIVSNTFNQVEESIPEAYQIINGNKHLIECKYALNGKVVSFSFPNGYDTNYELVIDPTLEFSSYTGSTADNFGFTATYNNNGELFGGGIVFGSGYPFVEGSYSDSFGGGGTDMGITRFNEDGTDLLYSTYIGGNGPDAPHSMIINSQGELVVYGTTGSNNFPMTVTAYRDTFLGGPNLNLSQNGMTYSNGSDIVILVLSEDGTVLNGSTYLGGAANDGVNLAFNLAFNYGDEFRGEVIVDSLDNIYIASTTLSSDIQIAGGGLDNTLDGAQDGYVAKLNPDLSSLLWSTYLGGSDADAAYSMKLANNGTLYVSGGTESSDLDIPASGLNPTYSGGSADGYLVALSNDGTSQLAGTFIGTNLYDQSYFVEVDGDQDVYVVGQALGSYPVTASYSNAGSKQFIQKLNPDLTTSIYSTVIGSGASTINISPTAFLVDVCERVYIGGWGGTTNGIGNTNGMPVTPDAFQSTTDGSDFYFFVLEADATDMLYATYFGGNGVAEHVDGGTSRFDKNGIIYEAVCAGCGGSDDFPTTPGAWSETNGASNCNLGVIKLNMELTGVDVEILSGSDVTGCEVPFEVQFDSDTLNIINMQWDFGDGNTSTEADPVHTYQNPGVYTVTLTGENFGLCGNITFTDTAFATISVFEPLTEANAGPDTISCSGANVVIGTPAVADVTYSWSPNTGLNFDNVAQPESSPSDPTEYILTTEDINGCMDADTVLVDVFTIEADGDTALCEGGDAPLSVSGGASWIWNPSGPLDDPFAQSPTATLTSTTTFTVQSDNGDGCTATDVVVVTVNPNPTANAGTDVSVCEGEEVPLAAGGGTEYSWSPTAGLNDPTISNPLASPTTDTEYEVLVTDANGCQDVDQVLVTVIPPPAVIASPDTAICLGETVQISVTGATTYLWDPLAGLVDPNDQPLASPTLPTMYYVEGEDDNGCKNSDSVFVDVFLITAGPDTTICAGDSVQVAVSGGESFIWTPTDGVSDPSSPTPYVYSDASTEFSVIATNNRGCEDGATVTLSLLTPPEANFEVSPEPSCEGVQLDITNLSNNADRYYWDFGNGNTGTDLNATQSYPSGNGPVIYLVGYNNDGLCTDTMFLDLSSEQFGYDTLTVEFGNVITPNFDGYNDCFKPEFSGEYSDCYELLVYNRWGNLQFESVAGQQHCWDGRNKAGQLVSKGTYYYIVRINDFEKAGYVEVVAN